MWWGYGQVPPDMVWIPFNARLLGRLGAYGDSTKNPSFGCCYSGDGSLVGLGKALSTGPCEDGSEPLGRTMVGPWSIVHSDWSTVSSTKVHKLSSSQLHTQLRASTTGLGLLSTRGCMLHFSCGILVFFGSASSSNQSFAQ